MTVTRYEFSCILGIVVAFHSLGVPDTASPVDSQECPTSVHALEPLRQGPRCSMGPAIEGAAVKDISSLQQLQGAVEARKEALEIQIYAGAVPVSPSVHNHIGHALCVTAS